MAICVRLASSRLVADNDGSANQSVRDTQEPVDRPEEASRQIKLSLESVKSIAKYLANLISRLDDGLLINSCDSEVIFGGWIFS